MAKLGTENVIGSRETTSKLGGPTLGIKDTEEITCSKCGSKVFDQALLLRRVPAVVTGTGQPGIIPVPIFSCHDCGAVLEELLPQGLN